MLNLFARLFEDVIDGDGLYVIFGFVVIYGVSSVKRLDGGGAFGPAVRE
jgi:hypothetical protein